MVLSVLLSLTVYLLLGTEVRVLLVAGWVRRILLVCLQCHLLNLCALQPREDLSKVLLK